MTTNDIDAIRRREQAATPGPWRAHTTYPHTVWQGPEDADDPGIISTTLAHEVVADAEFVAHARTDIPALLAELDRVRADLAAAHNHAHRTDAEIQRLTRDGIAYANENARLRSKLAEQEAETGAYLIWSHHHDAWWGPNAQGYRGNVADAGRYATRDAAVKQYKGRGCYCCLVPEVAVPAPLPGQMDSASLVKLIAVATEAEIDAGRINKHAHCGEVGTSFPNGTDLAYTEPCRLPNGHDEDHDWAQREAESGVSR